MNVALALVILGWLVVGCVFLYVDVCEECRFQSEQAEREELLDALRDEDAA